MRESKDLRHKNKDEVKKFYLHTQYSKAFQARQHLKREKNSKLFEVSEGFF